MTTHIEGNARQLTGFKMIWTFDPMTTAYLFDGEDMSKKHRQATLNKLAKSIIHNMLSTHYFTYFYDGGKPIRYEKVTAAKLTTSHGKATLTFNLPLAKPYTHNQHRLKLMIYDPTYFVDMSWKNAKNIILAPQLEPHCTFKIIAPHPTPAQVSYAASIPVGKDPDHSIGQLFTQTLDLTCNPANHDSASSRGK